MRALVLDFKNAIFGNGKIIENNHEIKNTCR